MCGLSPFADAMVGSLGVEQKKRTTIGVELAAKVRSKPFNSEKACNGLTHVLCGVIAKTLAVLG